MGCADVDVDAGGASGDITLLLPRGVSRSEFPSVHEREWPRAQRQSERWPADRACVAQGTMTAVAGKPGVFQRVFAKATVRAGSAPPLERFYPVSTRRFVSLRLRLMHSRDGYGGGRSRWTARTSAQSSTQFNTYNSWACIHSTAHYVT